MRKRSDEVERIREASGCFVLLTNTPTAGEMAHSPEDVLTAYKEQHGIERNFGFLKDPLTVNDIFLKRPDCIEVLGFILLMDFSLGLEPHGACDASVLEAHGFDRPRLGQEAYADTDIVHDDNEIQGGTGSRVRWGVAVHCSTNL